MIIKKSKIEISISKKCKILGVNRSPYYKWCNRKNNHDDTVDRLVIEIFNKHKGTYGRKRITLALNLMGYKVNHKKVYRIICEQDLKGMIRRKRRKSIY